MKSKKEIPTAAKQREATLRLTEDVQIADELERVLSDIGSRLEEIGR
jgi:hypothetical protein